MVTPHYYKTSLSPPSSAVLSMFTTAQGGIIDDCIITRSGPHSFFVVSNAGRAEEVQGHVKVKDACIAKLFPLH